MYGPGNQQWHLKAEVCSGYFCQIHKTSDALRRIVVAWMGMEEAVFKGPGVPVSFFCKLISCALYAFLIGGYAFLFDFINRDFGRTRWETITPANLQP
ncbi:unnamed protein product [Cuscuta campestris]|uniref:Uncharacterized protein n=1 Tax=Cuscuta campestris TaxID=132261 RepID=A0A484MKU8_9ASTE|nr:unnamed protein product [Cuscuta campestris]VFQ89102.1 unnamed protein product [Cuscuta campestris]